MTSRKTHWLRTTLIILLLCSIVGLGLSSYLFFKNPTPTAATATLEFTFQGAADGIAPNNVSFNVADIASEETLLAALKERGLEDTYTVEQLQSNLVARGVYPADMTTQAKSYESLLNFTANRTATFTSYHPTAYDIALYNDFDKSISKADLESLLKSILTAYRDKFSKVYANGLRKDNMLFALDAYDYTQQLEILQGHFRMLANYADEMSALRPSFQYEGMGFNDISVRLNNLIDNDIVRLNADLTMNALSRDRDRLLTRYQFGSYDLGVQLEKQQAQLEKLDKLINSYDKNGIIYVATGDSLSKIDGNSSETYDALVLQREALSNNIASLNAQIATYQLKLSDLSAEDVESSFGDEAQAEEESVPEQTPKAEDKRDETVPPSQTRAQCAALEKNIDALVRKGDAIIDDFQAMLNAYNTEEINDKTVSVSHYGYNTPSLLSGAFIKQAIKTAGPICALGFMVCMVLIILSRRKEEAER